MYMPCLAGNTGLKLEIVIKNSCTFLSKTQNSCNYHLIWRKTYCYSDIFIIFAQFISLFSSNLSNLAILELQNFKPIPKLNERFLIRALANYIIPFFFREYFIRL